jgi:hypothetical protein
MSKITCTQCPATFAYKGNLINHINKVHTISQKISSNKILLDEVNAIECVNCSVYESKCESNTNQRIMELEYQLKMKDMEFKYQLEIQALKSQNEFQQIIQQKDLEIKELQMKLLAKESTPTPIEPIIQQSIQPIIQAPQALQQPIIQQPIIQAPQSYTEILALQAVRHSNELAEKDIKIQQLELEYQRKQMLLNKKLQKNDELVVKLVEPVAPVIQAEDPVEDPIEEADGEIPTLKQSKLDPIEYLDKYYVEAVSLEEVSKLFKDADYNKYIDCCCVKNTEQNILAPEYILESEFMESPADNAVKIMKALFTKLEPNEVPFYYHKTKKDIYFKTNKGWLMDNERNSEELNKVLLNFIKTSLSSVQWAVGNTSNIYKNGCPQFYSRYNITYADWTYKHSSEYTAKTSSYFETTEEKTNALKKMKGLIRDWN